MSFIVSYRRNLADNEVISTERDAFLRLFTTSSQFQDGGPHESCGETTGTHHGFLCFLSETRLVHVIRVIKLCVHTGASLKKAFMMSEVDGSENESQIKT